jgi:hypothetical protein
MTAITPLTSQQIPELQSVLEMAEAAMGIASALQSVTNHTQGSAL